MKKIATIVLGMLLSAGMAFAQTPQSAQPATPPAGQQSARQQRMQQRQQRMQQHEQMMQQHLQQAQAKVDQLKADLAKVSDAATKQALQDDADMWQMMIDHMKNMSQGGGMMGHPKGMKGKGMGMKGGMGCAGMGSTPPTQGEPPAQEPK